MNGRSFFKLINLTFEWYIKENLKIHHDNNLLKNMVLKFEFELFILDDFRKVSKSKIGVPLRVPFWAGVRLNTTLDLCPGYTSPLLFLALLGLTNPTIISTAVSK